MPATTMTLETDRFGQMRLLLAAFLAFSLQECGFQAHPEDTPVLQAS
jgi:hypothetical protein